MSTIIKAKTIRHGKLSTRIGAWAIDGDEAGMGTVKFLPSRTQLVHKDDPACAGCGIPLGLCSEVSPRCKTINCENCDHQHEIVSIS